MDARSAKEVERTRQALQDLERRGGAEVRLISGADMSPLYGNTKSYLGIQHTKAVHISTKDKEWLWVGSCNFTRASDYNIETMAEISQQKNGSPLHEVFGQFEEQFRRRYAQSIMQDWPRPEAGAPRANAPPRDARIGVLRPTAVVRNRSGRQRVQGLGQEYSSDPSPFHEIGDDGSESDESDNEDQSNETPDPWRAAWNPATRGPAA